MTTGASLQELKQFPTLKDEIATAANEALERFREDSKKTTLRLVEMESSYITVDFFRKLTQDVDKGGNPAPLTADRYAEGHLQRIGSNVLSYVGMVSETLRNTIPKAVVHCQVREAKRSLLDHFYVQLGQKEVHYFKYESLIILYSHLSHDQGIMWHYKDEKKLNAFTIIKFMGR